MIIPDKPGVGVPAVCLFQPEPVVGVILVHPDGGNVVLSNDSDKIDNGFNNVILLKVTARLKSKINKEKTLKVTFTFILFSFHNTNF
jgi:hypothetical protein